ncbi:Protein PLANT CADMIUM RESISTANCE 8 [Acorus gramineus]|uniref:Protein PLANT CADMIUM RESISTANCE 8 n=1 Tax=Acorus gramineus TaxID=55184 RepID=A0AAV9ALE8_ACOGR|nr:Protein PLANT CADMIUM RESISTANCE 8 [Acorus gramineus]
MNWAAPEDEVSVQFTPQPEVQHVLPVQSHVPPVQPPPVVIGLPWTTGLFDCHEHESNAVLTAFFPCVTFGQIAEILERGQTRCSLGSLMYMMMAPAVCSCWILGSIYRGRLRQRYNLVEAPTEDWIAHAFCPCCALCQEFRELKNRGIDPSLGKQMNTF